MTDVSADRDWTRLLQLLEPFHVTAQTAARRMAASVEEGDDLFQESLLHAFEKLSSLRDETRFRSWFFAILISRHRTRSRRSFWRRFLPLENVTEGAEPRVSSPDGEEEWLASWRMSSALATLSAPEREALVLFEWQGFSTEEIAELQSAGASTIRSRLTRARAKVARVYIRRGWAEPRRPRNALGIAAVHPGGSR